jgi:hypothetical protein
VALLAQGDDRFEERVFNMPHQMIRVLLGLVLVLSSCHVQAMVATNEPGVPIMDVPASDIVQEMTASPVFTPPTDATDDSAAVQQLTSMVADTTVEPRHVPDGGHKVDQSGKGIGEMHRGPSIPLTENEGDKILDEIETSTPTDNIDNWNMDSLVEETKKSEERKKMIEQKHEEIQKTKLREQALKLKKKVELEQLVLEAEKRCSQWSTINEESEAALYDLFQEGINASLAARDGSKYHEPPALVEKQLHITSLSINAMKCHMSYIESLKAMVDKICDISKNIRSLLNKYIETPDENVLLPSIDIDNTVSGYHTPTRPEINVLKLTAANAHAKVKAAKKEYQMHSARLEALEIEDEKDIEEAGSASDDAEQSDKIPPHMLPIEVLFQHITGRQMEDEVPKEQAKMLQSEKKRIEGQMEDCFGDECDDPKVYDGAKQL